jgi:hypothetical protein
MTPFYSEDILYNEADLAKETEDGVSVLLYLQTVFPKQWKNFCQRIGVHIHLIHTRHSNNNDINDMMPAVNG